MVLVGLAGTAQSQDSCQLLVFQPGQTDGEVSDTAPIQGSICYAFGVTPGQDVDLALTYGSQAQFSIAGLVQDRRRFEFTAERSLYEIRVHQGTGATDVEPFVLAIHAEPLPLPEPPVTPPPVSPDRQETAEAAPESAPESAPETEAPEPTGTAAADNGPEPGSDQQVATQESGAPEPASDAVVSPEPASVDLTPPAPEDRVYGPGWTVQVVADGSAARAEGTATDYVSRFEARCAESLAQGVHVTLRGDPGFVLSRTADAVNQTRLVITGTDGSTQSFDTSLAYQPDLAAWNSRDPLPTAFLEAFSNGALMAVRSASDRSVATFLLYGAEDARAALGPLCAAGPAAVAAAATPASAAPAPVQPEAAVSTTSANQGTATDAPDFPQASFSPGWVMTQQGNTVVATGGDEDGGTQFVGRCAAGAGVDATLRGDPGRVLSRTDGAVTPIRIEIRMEDGEAQRFDSALVYDAADDSWHSQEALPGPFREAFGYGIAMNIDSAAGARIAQFRLRGTLQIVLHMNTICPGVAVAAAQVTEPAPAAAVAPSPAPVQSATPAVDPVPVAAELTEVPPIGERTYGPGWAVTLADDGSDIVVAGTATDYLTRFQASCDVSLPAGIHVTLSGSSVPGLPRTADSATPVRVEVTANDGTVQTYTTALTYHVAQNAWRSGLPLSVGFVDAFTRGALMKIATDGGATVATFILAGLADAREPMTKICASGTTGTLPAAAATAPPPPPVQAEPSVPPSVPPAAPAQPAGEGWVISAESNGVSARGLAVDSVSVLRLRCGAGLPPGVQLSLSGDPHGRLQRGGTQPVRIEITDDDQAPELFSTVLSYQGADRSWSSQLPLPASFVYAFGHGVIMKIFTADGVPAATFILFGTAEARDRMRAVCGF